MQSFDNRNHNFNLVVPRQYRGYFAKFYAFPDSDPIGMLRAPWETSLRLFWACSKLGGDLGDLGDLTAICSAATALCEISQRPCGDQRRSGRFCTSQRGRRPVWLGYNIDPIPARYWHVYMFTFHGNNNPHWLKLNILPCTCGSILQFFSTKYTLNSFSNNRQHNWI